jgi:hypothetical protein
MNTGMTFNDGPMISGHWYNAKTGDSFTVKDTYFEDNNLYVLTTDGRRLNYEMFSKYIQTEKPMPKQQPQQPKKKDTLPPEVAKEIAGPGDDYEGLLTDEDKALLLGKPIASQKPTVVSMPEQKVELDEDALLIKRMLDRTTQPIVAYKILWDKFPFKQMDMLDTMCVDPKRIADYYINKLSIDEIHKSLADEIEKYIYSSLHGASGVSETIEMKSPEEDTEYLKQTLMPQEAPSKKVARKPAQKKDVQSKKKK